MSGVRLGVVVGAAEVMWRRKSAEGMMRDDRDLRDISFNEVWVGE